MTKSAGKRKEPVSGTANTGYHVPVMLREAIEGLDVKPAGIYVDCTFGGGGHSGAILAQLGPEGKLVAFDQDADAVRNLPADPRLLFIPENFRHMQRFLRLHKCIPVDGILADLGVSSHQLDEPSRGFSFRFDAPLDMRMDQRSALTAANVVNEYSEKQLQDIFSTYGEVTNARTLAAAIAAFRSNRKFVMISDLLQVLTPMSKGNPNRYYAQVFQALRIEVNDELGALRDWLLQLPAVLKPGARVAVITFHSLEDRLVKLFLRDGAFIQEKDPLYGSGSLSPFNLITKKPVTPGDEELRINDRSRSARLRVAVFKG